MNVPTHILGAGIGSLFLAATALGDGFDDFRAEAQRKIPAGWVCSEIRTLEGRTLFDVSSQTNRFSIVITRCELISQKEWTSRFERAKMAIDQMIADKKPDEDAVTALLDGLHLPDGRYGGVAVSIDRSEPDIHYPEIEDDDDKSKEVQHTILSLVESYSKSEKVGADQPATAPQLRAEEKEKPKSEETHPR